MLKTLYAYTHILQWECIYYLPIWFSRKTKSMALETDPFVLFKVGVPIYISRTADGILNQVTFINSPAYSKGSRNFFFSPLLVDMFDFPSLFWVGISSHFNDFPRLSFLSLNLSSKLYSFSPKGFVQVSRSGLRIPRVSTKLGQGSWSSKSSLISPHWPKHSSKVRQDNCIAQRWLERKCGEIKYWKKFEQLSWLVQFSSVSQLCLTLCNLMDCSMPRLSIHHELLELAKICVHRVCDPIQPSDPLSFPSSPAFNTSQHQGLFQ